MTFEEAVEQACGVSIPIRALVFVYGLDENGDRTFYEKWINYVDPDESPKLYDQLADVAFLQNGLAVSSILEVIDQEEE